VYGLIPRKVVFTASGEDFMAVALDKNELFERPLP
jgi:hypothetical protein